MPPDRIVAVGFLTQNDLNVLGKGFNRLFPVAEDTGFDDLLKKLEGIAAVPLDTNARRPADPLGHGRASTGDRDAAKRKPPPA